MSNVIDILCELFSILGKRGLLESCEWGTDCS